MKTLNHPREKIREYERKWYAENRDKVLASNMRYRRSIEGYAITLYLMIKARLNNPKYKSYLGRKLLFSKSDFLSWLKGTIYSDLHTSWVESSFDKKLSPSVDRVDNNGDYTLSNIQIITKGENAGKDSPKRAVVQRDMSNNFIAEYSSIAEASRQTGIAKQYIHANLTGKTKYAKGFIWEDKQSRKSQ